jgi:hypothetical protein
MAACRPQCYEYWKILEAARDTIVRCLADESASTVLRCRAVVLNNTFMQESARPREFAVPSTGRRKRGNRPSTGKEPL